MKNDHDLAALQRLQPKRNARGAASPEFPTGVRGGCVLSRGTRGPGGRLAAFFARIFVQSPAPGRLRPRRGGLGLGATASDLREFIS